MSFYLGDRVFLSYPMDKRDFGLEGKIVVNDITSVVIRIINEEEGGADYKRFYKEELTKLPPIQGKREYIVVADVDAYFETREEAIKQAIACTEGTGKKYCVFELNGTTTNKVEFEEIKES